MSPPLLQVPLSQHVHPGLERLLGLPAPGARAAGAARRSALVQLRTAADTAVTGAQHALLWSDPPGARDLTWSAPAAARVPRRRPRRRRRRPPAAVHSHSHAAAAQEAVLWPYRGHCASFHNFCYYFLQIFFIGAAMSGVALVLADAFFRQRWPHVHGLLFIGVLLVFVSAVMLFVLCQRGAGVRGAAENHVAKEGGARVPEAIPLRDVPAVYVQPGLATLRRQQPGGGVPVPEPYAESEYSHPWDQVTGISSRPDMSEVCSMATLNSRGRPPGPRHWQ
ncbi:hypothetical protein FJT64_014506 [Amphibalanus amphitrite]|uniref:Uncharacterized protein n=1 Tax=Amphibalanus amphitrite TaxID=1232801 RepID=A0A6A4UTJ1_AMPAM|nr:hypothetical protein FJT64_014506 [Amphibalanus amphitrite]